MFLFGMGSVWTEIKHDNQNTVQMLYIINVIYTFENLEVIVSVFMSHIDKTGLKADCCYSNRSTLQLLVPRGLRTRVSCVSKNEGTYRLSPVATRIYN